MQKDFIRFRDNQVFNEILDEKSNLKCIKGNDILKWEGNKTNYVIQNNLRTSKLEVWALNAQTCCIKHVAV